MLTIKDVLLGAKDIEKACHVQGSAYVVRSVLNQEGLGLFWSQFLQAWVEFLLVGLGERRHAHFPCPIFVPPS